MAALAKTPGCIPIHNIRPRIGALHHRSLRAFATKRELVEVQHDGVESVVETSVSGTIANTDDTSDSDLLKFEPLQLRQGDCRTDTLVPVDAATNRDFPFDRIVYVTSYYDDGSTLRTLGTVTRDQRVLTSDRHHGEFRTTIVRQLPGYYAQVGDRVINVASTTFGPEEVYGSRTWTESTRNENPGMRFCMLQVNTPPIISKIRPFETTVPSVQNFATWPFLFSITRDNDYGQMYVSRTTIRPIRVNSQHVASWYDTTLAGYRGLYYGTSKLTTSYLVGSPVFASIDYYRQAPDALALIGMITEETTDVCGVNAGLFTSGRPGEVLLRLE